MILYEVTAQSAGIRISSGKGNPIDAADIESLHTALDRVAGDDLVKSIAFRGEERCFCTGLNAGSAGGKELDDLFLRFDSLLLRLFTFPKPVVVVLDGHSIGGGLLLQCCADYVVGVDSPKAKIGLPELKIGLTIDALMAELLDYSLGSRHTLQQLLYGGEYISIGRAKEINLIDELSSREELESAARNAEMRLQAYDSSAFRATKTALRAPAAARMRAALDRRCFEIFNELK